MRLRRNNSARMCLYMNMPRPRALSSQLLEAALAGLEQKKAEIERNIDEVRSAMGDTARSSPNSSLQPGARKQRHLSTEARARIAAAQRARWAKQKKAAAKK